MRIISILVLIFTERVYLTVAASPNLPSTAKERGVLQQFKRQILPKIPTSSLIYNISVHDDLYLLQFIRYNRLNLNDAEHHLLQNLRWREQENIDGIHLEDWTTFQQDYPAFSDTFDKAGRPTAEIWFSDWDIRRGVLTGQGKRLTRWINFQYEMNMRRLYQLRKGKSNVTNTILLTDAEGFSFKQGCPLCAQIFVRLGADWENYYPNLFKNAVGINVTPAFQMMLDGFRPFLRPETRDHVVTYVRRSHWQPVLDKEFDKSQRSLRFGGTIQR